ncbi:MAG: glycosyltransferase family 4 protein [Halioglobus sp.]
MRVLHVNNQHRGVGGSDAACHAVIDVCSARGMEIGFFERDSKNLPSGLKGKVQAFFGGIYNRSAVEDFDRTLTEFKPDVVHVHELFPMISPWILPRCTAAGVPVVMTCYDFRITCPVATHHNKSGICHECMGGKEYRALLNNCRQSLPESLAYGLRSAVASRFGLFTDHITRFIVLTEFSKQWIENKAGIASDRVATIPCVIPSPETGIDDPSEGAYVAYAGRFVPEKGVEILLEACRRANLPLRLAGDSMEHPAIRPEDDAVCIATPTPQSLIDFYRGARVLVVASLWEETFAVVLSEAKSHGVPVIAPRIGAMPDLVQDDVTGLLFETGNVEELTQKISRVWNDTELCRRLGAAGRLDIQTELNEDVCFDRHLKLYEEVAAESREADGRNSNRTSVIACD